MAHDATCARDDLADRRPPKQTRRHSIRRFAMDWFPVPATLMLAGVMLIVALHRAGAS